MFPFRFIKYTQPGWQFNVEPAVEGPVASAFYHPKYQPLKSDFIEEDLSFETDAARFADVGYRNWQGGVLATSDRAARAKIHSLQAPSLNDEYQFVAKYWGNFFTTYALVCRLLSLNNSLKELAAFSKLLKVKKTNPFVNVHAHGDYDRYESALLIQQPFVSVIIPTLNRYFYLKDALHDLEKQTWSNFEVIVMDQSEQFDGAFYRQFNLQLQVKQQREKKLWTARNQAIKMSTADYLLFFDDDSRIEPDWIEQHMKTLDYFDADISAGVSFATIGGKISGGYKYFKWADQFDSGNALVKREVFERIGLFDVQYNKMRQGDGEFGYRAFQNGVKSISNPYAFRIHLKVKEGGLREIGSWDAFRQKKWFQPRPVPSVVFQYFKYLPKELAKHTLLIGMLLSNVHLKHKRNKYMLLWSSVLFLLKSPVIYLQFRKSKSIAKQMLLRDNGIEKLQPQLV